MLDLRRLVVNCRTTRCDVYIGRGSIWGNPFTHLPLRDTLAQFQVKSRAEAIERYEDWIQTQPELLARLSELRGRTLGCWCRPLVCHGDVLALLANR